jgi:hypothetical protein
VSRAPRPIGRIPSGVPASKDAIPERERARRADVDLEPVLAGVAGARDERPVVAGSELEAFVEAERANALAVEPRDHVLGLGTLYRELRRLGVLVVHGHVRRAVLLDPGEILLEVRGVHDEQPVVAESVDEEVVDDPAALQAHRRVDHLAFRELPRLVRDEPVRESDGATAGQPDLTHVGDVEDPDPGADRPVLGHDPFVLDRHLVPGKGDHLGPEGHVAGVERSALERGGRFEHPLSLGIDTASIEEGQP